ncbi:hypothetical protein [Virgibacillus dakarensis]|uniref:hypothetical protein n=1 Tax=Virgibacillus dakarensis TaxID=1917889 RepID=UPI0013564C6B|nr:hypothetical protein [Virgibacillus dakarensis]
MSVHSDTNALATMLVGLALLQQNGEIHVTREIFAVVDQLTRELDLQVKPK